MRPQTVDPLNGVVVHADGSAAAAASLPMAHAVPAGPQPYVAPLLMQPSKTWQQNLIGWHIEAQQYTSGAIVGGLVLGYDQEQSHFTLKFENGSIEPAFLPQPTVRLIDEHGTRIGWVGFFDRCRGLGVPIDQQTYYDAANAEHATQHQQQAAAMVVQQQQQQATAVPAAVPEVAAVHTAAAVAEAVEYEPDSAGGFLAQIQRTIAE